MREKPGQCQTVKIRHVHVHQNHVWFQLHDDFNGLAAFSCPCHQIDCGIQFQQLTCNLQECGGIVDHNRPDTGWVRFAQWLLRQFISQHHLCGCCHPSSPP